MQFELRADHDHGTSGVVDALAEQVLAEASLLALEGVGERLQRTVVGATQHAATAAVVEQGVHGFLQHALFVAHDDFGSVQVHQLLQPVVAVDHAAIEVVEVGSGKAAAIQWNEGAQLRWNDRQNVENHPLRLVAAAAEGLDHFQALGVLQALLQRVLVLHLLAQLDGELFDIDALQQFLDGFGAHHGLESGGPEFHIELAELGLFLNDFMLFERGVAGIDDYVGFEVEHRFEIAQGDIEEVADTRRQAFEEPDMGAGRSQLDVSETLAAHLGQGDFDATLVASDPAVLHAFIFPAETLPVGYRPKDSRAEQSIAFRLEGAVINGLRLGNLTMRPAADFFRRGHTDADSIKFCDCITQVKRT